MNANERMAALQTLADFYEEAGEKWKAGMIRAVITHERHESALERATAANMQASKHILPRLLRVLEARTTNTTEP